MKKLLLALGALATLAMVAPSCKGKDPKQKQKEEVKELSVNPTSFELYKGDKIRFALTGADVNVTLVPNSASYTLESSDVNVAKVDGKVVTAMNEGNATITVKAGDKTATVALTVKGKAAIDETRFLGGKDIYIPVFDGNMKAKKAEIAAAMESREWDDVTTQLPSDYQKVLFYFRGKQGARKIFTEVNYIHTPSKGPQFMIAQRIMMDDGTWAQGAGKEILKEYGFAESEIEETTLNDAENTPALSASKDDYMVLLYAKREKVKDQDGNEMMKDVYTMQITGKQNTQRGELVDLSKNINILNPLNRTF